MKRLVLLLVLPLFLIHVNASTVVTVGTSDADYSTLYDAFYDVNKGYLSGDVIIKITSNTNETSAATLTASGKVNPGGTSNYTSVTVYPTVTGVTISGNLASDNVIDLEGADHVTIDGRVNATGNTPSLIIENSANVGATAVGLSYGAEYNAVKYCVLKGYSTTSRGVINLDNRSGTAGIGDSHNLFDNNVIRGNATGTPYFGIYALGLAGSVSFDNTISNNSFPDFLQVGSSSSGVKIGANCSTWTVKGNNFYCESGTFAATGSFTTSAISIISGSGYVVENNYIGGTSVRCGGAKLVKTNGGDQTFSGIDLVVGSGSATSVQGNVIQNIDWSNSGKNTFYGIYVELSSTGDVNIGTISGNTIGSNTGAGSITYTAAVTGGNVYGIYSNTSGNLICNYNLIGSLTGNNTDGFTTNMSAIYVGGTSGNCTINYNTIGSSDTPNSIISTAATSSENVYGINVAGLNTNEINHNVISNLTTGSTVSGAVYGIYLNGGTNSVNANFIHSFAVTSNASTSSSSAMQIGIGSVKGSNLITNNVIRLGGSTYGSIIYGLYELNSATSTSILHNTVYIGDVNPTPGAQKSYGLYSAGTTNSRLFKNNILVNARTGGTGTKVAATITANTTGTLTVDYNDFVPAYTTLGTNSLNANPGFTSAGGVTVASYNKSATLNGLSGTGVASDFGGTTRASTPQMGALESAYSSPALTLSTSTLSGFSYIEGNGPSATQTFTLSGSHLIDNITLSASADYEISTNAVSGFSNYITLAPTSGSLANTTIYVRLEANLGSANYSAQPIVVNTSGVSASEVLCSGVVNPVPPLVSLSTQALSNFNYAVGAGPSASQYFVVDATHLTQNLIITPSINYQISFNPDTNFTSSSLFVVPSSGTIAAKIIYVRLKTGLANGIYNSENITISSVGATSLAVTCNGSTASGKTFTVTAPAGTSHIYIAGSFTLKNWDIVDPYELTRLGVSNQFTGTFICDNSIQYKYLNEKGDWDYQAAVSVGGASETNRSYNASDVVAAWLNVKQIQLNVSFATTGVPTQLFAKGSWDNWTTPVELIKSGDTFSKILGGNSGDKFSGSTQYKYYTNEQSLVNWEANANGTLSSNRWAIDPVMTDQIARFTIVVPEPSNQQWRSLPIRSKAEYDQNMPGGEGEQIFHGFSRCLTNPDYIYGCHDVMGTWRSTDGGATWHKNIDKGLWLPFTRSIEVDPVNPNLVFVEVNNGWWSVNATSSQTLQGVYRSEDGGTNWTQMFYADNTQNERRMRHLIAYSSASMATPKTSPTRWYAAVDKNGLYRSDNSGVANSWSKVAAIDTIITDVVPHPTLLNVVYVTTDKGLFKSSNGGATLTLVPTFGGDRITSFVINPKDTTKIYVVVVNEKGLATLRNGMYVSTNGGATYTKPVFWHPTKAGVEVTTDCKQVYLNPGFPEQIFWIGGSNYGNITQLSNDGGVRWSNPLAKSITFPGLARETGWRRSISGEFASVLPDPKNKYGDVVATGASTIVKITDLQKSTPKVFESAAGFTGNSSMGGADAINFHPTLSTRMMFSCNDIGPRTTTTGGKWFHEPDSTFYAWWQKDARLEWAGAYSADYQPSYNGTPSSVVVSSCGLYNEHSQLMRSSDFGVHWDTLTTVPPLLDVNNVIVRDTLGNIKWDVKANRQAFEYVGFDPEVGYENYVYSGNMMSTDGGITFNYINYPVSSYSGVYNAITNPYHTCLPTVLGISKDTNGHSHLIAVNGYKTKIWRSDDHGATWYNCYTNPQSNSLKFLDRIIAFAVHPTNPNIYFIMTPGTHDLRKVVYNPSTATSTNTDLNIFRYLPSNTPAEVISSNQIRYVTIDPIEPNTMYVGMSFSGIPNVYVSYNGGSTWAPMADGLSCHGGSIKVNPHTGELYRGSMAGVWIAPTPRSIITEVKPPMIENNELKVFANKASELIKIYGAEETTPFVIYNLMGRIVKNFTGNSTSLVGLPSGVYILKSNTYSPVKFMKN
ncbi:MAG: T9SS type A sorting domain-containing protein [Bacteroidales bacterium]|nr:T9SS type A sorting domain-containing protein [Bacteroidales bacterium]